MQHTPRRLSLVTTFAIALTLAACSSNDQTETTATNNENTTTTEANTIPTNFPAFTSSNNRWKEMEAQGCSPNFEQWARDAIIYFTDANEGNAEHVQITFESKDILGGRAKACEATVQDAQILGTAGGDLNNFTMLFHGLPEESNPVDLSTALQVWETKETDRGVRELDQNTVANLSPVALNLIDYANSKQAIDGSLTYNTNQGQLLLAELHGVDTHIAANNNIPLIHDESLSEGTEGVKGGWVAITTNDQQIDTDREGSNAAGQAARAFARTVNNLDGKQIIKIHD